MTTGTIKLTYGNFTCTFDRVTEEDVLTRAIITQIATIVMNNPSFGGSVAAAGTPPTSPQPTKTHEPAPFGSRSMPSPAAQHPMRLENPVTGPVSVSVSDESAQLTQPSAKFDTAFNDKPLEFIRSKNMVEQSVTHHVADNTVLLEKYEILRAAVLRMLNEASDVLTSDITTLKQQAPIVPVVKKQTPLRLEPEQRKSATHGSTLRAFPMPR